MKDFKESFLEKFSEIPLQFNNSNFVGCRRLSTELISVADFVDFLDGVLIGEIFESVFMNLDEINDHYEIEKEELMELNELINNILKLLNNSNLNINEKNKTKLYDLLKDVRGKVTRIQLSYLIIKKPKKEESGVSLPFPQGALKMLGRVP
ncbi:MAG: hypothetical protein O8C62_03095 [Candidatus Methanoperedens sp.]|nr:hypothetical protein [Candidatus Methanoperedens sp.]